MKAHVWVMPKRTVLDPQGQTIQHALSGLGYAEVKDVRQGKFFVLNLDGWNRDEAQKQLDRISKEVLTNPVIEEYRFEIVDYLRSGSAHSPETASQPIRGASNLRVTLKV